MLGDFATELPSGLCLTPYVTVICVFSDLCRENIALVVCLNSVFQMSVVAASCPERNPVQAVIIYNSLK